jgi:hypothetical protein
MVEHFKVTSEGENGGLRVEVSAEVAFVAHHVGTERSGRLASITPILHGTTYASDQVKLAEEQSRQKYLNKLRANTSVLIPAKAEKALDALCKAVRQVEEQSAVDGTARPKSSPSQATQIVQLAHDSGIELFHTPDHQAYLTVPLNGHRETYALTGRSAKDWLAKAYYDKTQSAPNAAALTDTLTTLAGQAKYDRPEHPVYVRVAQHDDAIYLDLGDATWRTVKITADGWSVADRCPVYFRRPRGILSLPVPGVDGSIEALRPFVNIKDDDFILAVNWLVAALRPTGPYPALNITGEQGSAKSTTARILRSLVDPNGSPLRAVPRDERDLMIAAKNAHVCAFDNLSKIPKWLSDALCRLATGGGFSTRQLYTDDDETLFDAMRPVLFTGITDVAIEGDLADRAIALTAPVIPDRQRRTEHELWMTFEAEKPRILGALLTAVAEGMKNIDTTQIPEPPRMADFAHWAVAAEPSFPWPAGRFLQAFVANRRGLIEASLDGNHLADLVQKIAPWEGTASELLARLNQHVPEHARPREWYGTPQAVSNALTRLAPLLRRVGVDVIRPGRTAAKRQIRLEWQPGAQRDDDDAGCDDTVIGDDAKSAKTGRNDASDANDAMLPTLGGGGSTAEALEVGEV